MLEGLHSVLNPQGPDAAVIAEIAWVLFAGGAVVFAAVMALAAYAVLARRERARRIGSEALVIGGGIVFPAIVLTALLAYTLLRTASLYAANEAPRLVIEVTGEQWWWRVRYLDAEGRTDFATANEIRVPVGQSVELRLESADVIHSFWVPALAGKLDMIPGRTNRLRIRAERPGEYRGQCAEYCGGPHAWMAFFVIAEEPERYVAWARTQREAARPPQSAPARRGAELFVAHCSACHAVRGTDAKGARGPDLTHFAGRRTLGAAVLPNTPEAVARWIASSQHVKPGNLMPSFASFSGEELAALTAYLRGLE